MNVIKPVGIFYFWSDVVETVGLWNHYVAYNIGDLVRCVLSGGGDGPDVDYHRIYRCKVAGTTATPPVYDAVNWMDIGPDARSAMIDSVVSTKSRRAGSLTITMDIPACNSLILFGLEGASVSILMTKYSVAREIIYGNDTLSGPRVIPLDGTIITDWYQYYFEPFVQKSELILTGLPTYAESFLTVTVTASAPGVEAACGICLPGAAYDLGGTEYGASLSITDYSKKTTDEYGAVTLVRRAFSKRLSAKMEIDNAQLNKVQSVLSDLRATPCAWVATQAQGLESLSVFGYYRDFSISVAYPTTSYCNLEIEGLI